MCGLAGSHNVDMNIEKMLNKIKHRGMDGQGIHKHEKSVHGHVRLSLLDHSEASSQPFYDNKCTLSFNGEIWNFKDLKNEMIDKGFIFKTTGDTEVLFNLLKYYGVNHINKLEGMFAFVWSHNDEHYIVRDRFGEIPIYIAKYKKGYIWASERKAFPIDCIPIAVPPGYLFNLKKEKWEKWYEIPSQNQIQSINLIEKINRGVEHRLVSDSPVCCLISGGLDSSLILKLSHEKNKNITAFTAKFNNNSTDLLASRKLCSDWGINLIEVDIDIDIEIIKDAMKCIEINSKAQIEIAVICIQMAKRIRAEGFKSCLSGEAADELFGGYGNFCIESSRTENNKINILRKKLLSKMSRGNFVRCNKSFMNGGVECRLPFMDLGLVEYAVNLNKIDSPPNKKLLKDNVDAIVPKWIIKRQKDTFQGGCGISDWTEKNIHNPVRFYNNELKKHFGYLPKD